MVARIQQGYNAGNTVVGGMLTSTNRFIDDNNLDFLSSNAYTGGLDLLHHWKDKEFFVDAKLLGSYVAGSTTAITALQESSARYYQRPDADYLHYDTTLTNLSGWGGKIRVGKGSKGFWRYSTGASWLSPGIELNDLGYMNEADAVRQENEVSFFVNQPVSIFRTYNITLEQFNSWNFNGTYLGSGGHLSFTSEFKNQWSQMTNFILHSGGIDTRILRGGYDMMMPYNLMFFGNVSTDASRKFIALLAYSYNYRGNNSASGYTVEPGITVRPFGSLKLGVSATYQINNDELQYVTSRDLPPPSDDRITVRKPTQYLELSVKDSWPDFQGGSESDSGVFDPVLWKSVYFTGAAIRNLNMPQIRNQMTITDRFKLYENPVLTDGTYYLDYNNDNVIDYTIGNPDFNFHQFRSNLVAKWEYRLGSFIYFVWSAEKTGTTANADASFKESYKEMKKIFPNNIFLIKLSYWFSL